MLLSQKKAVSALKPWWDFIYFYSLLALIITDILMLITFLPTLFQPKIKHERFNDYDNDTKNINRELPLLTDRMETITTFETFDHASIFPMYLLIILACLLMMESAYSRVFYNAHLVQTFCHIIETVSDMRQYKSLGHGIIFANTFHHASNRKSLWIMFYIFNGARAFISAFVLIMVIHSQWSYSINIKMNSQGHLMLVIISILILLFQIGCLSYACVWPWLIQKSPWGGLMKTYAITLDKIDIARGRCVPSPPNQRRSERILDALNPYMASPNIKLILDLLAYRSGVGVALRTLAHLEIDIQNNWRPFRLEIKGNPNGNGVEINWKDPLAVIYLSPDTPTELGLHYGIEITFASPDLERIVEIVGYDETRYYQQVWNASRPNSVGDLRSSSNLYSSVVYSELFADIPSGIQLDVAVWTIIDGMLISRSIKSYYPNDPECNSSLSNRQITTPVRSSPTPATSATVLNEQTPNLIPKPPRKLDKINNIELEHQQQQQQLKKNYSKDGFNSTKSENLNYESHNNNNNWESNSESNSSNNSINPREIINDKSSIDLQQEAALISTPSDSTISLANSSEEEGEEVPTRNTSKNYQQHNIEHKKMGLKRKSCNSTKKKAKSLVNLSGSNQSVKSTIKADRKANSEERIKHFSNDGLMATSSSRSSTFDTDEKKYSTHSALVKSSSNFNRQSDKRMSMGYMNLAYTHDNIMNNNISSNNNQEERNVEAII